MARFVFDIETNGFLEKLDRVHCIVAQDIDTGVTHSASTSPDMGTMSIEDMLAMLADAEELAGHNVIRFDLPALAKVYDFKFTGKVTDTLVCAGVIWPRDLLKGHDLGKAKKGLFPAKLAGKQSLEAWGFRLGNYKGDFKGPFDTLTRQMFDYCVQDVAVNVDLYQRIEAKEYSATCLEIEHDVARILHRQMTNGFGFDVAGGRELYTKLVKRRAELERELRSTFRPWFQGGVVFTPKRDNKKQGYTAGVPFTKVKLTEFNPASRDHIADRLIKLRGWKPKQATPDGKWKVDEAILDELQYPEAKVLSEFFVVNKRIGQLAEGNQAWLKVERDGRIYGYVDQNGAVTGRMTHAFPNVAQVPTVKKPYGVECRALFGPREGWWQVGIDAKGLEDRMLAGYMHKWDGGDYAKLVLEGDPHQARADILGVDRDPTAKRFWYALIYGASDWKLGFTLGATGSKQKVSRFGGAARSKLVENVPALGEVIDAVQKRAKRNGYITGLDGRQIHIRSPHAALNSLLQGGGAVVMKKALVILDASLQQHGYQPGADYEFLGNIHDEWQLEARTKEIAEHVGKLGCQSIKQAGEAFAFPCPLDGDFKVGRNWAECH